MAVARMKATSPINRRPLVDLSRALGMPGRFGRPPSVAAMAAHTRRVSILNAAASRGEGSAARHVRSGVTAALHDETFRSMQPCPDHPLTGLKRKRGMPSSVIRLPSLARQTAR
jgi:hypothetical protein